MAREVNTDLGILPAELYICEFTVVLVVRLACWMVLLCVFWGRPVPAARTELEVFRGISPCSPAALPELLSGRGTSEDCAVEAA